MLGCPVRRERIGAQVHLATVGSPVAVRVSGEGVGAPGVALGAVGEAVVVGVRAARIGARRHLVGIVEAIGIGVGGPRVRPEVLDLSPIVEAIAVGVGFVGSTPACTGR